MGIMLFLYAVPSRIPEADWRETFDEVMKISRAGGLAEARKLRLKGRNFWCNTLSVPRQKQTNKGAEVVWHTAGDLVTGNNMEDFKLPQDISIYNTEDNGADILGDLLEEPEAFGLEPPAYAYLWGAKTQGERGHMFLLSMACALADRFPEAVLIHGDITAGQCIKAAKYAGDLLGREIAIPVQFDTRRLYARAQAMAGEDRALCIRLFFALHQGIEDAAFLDFLRENISEDEYYVWLRSTSHDSRVNDVMRKWLDVTGNFRRLAELLVADPEGPQLAPEAFIEEVVDAKLFTEDHDTYDAAYAGREVDVPDNVHMQFARFFAIMAGVRNKNIDFCMPLEEIKSICRDRFGDMCDIDATFEEKIKLWETDEKKANVRDLYRYVHEESEKKNAEQESRYDHEELEDLFYWKENDTICPDLKANLVAALQKAWSVTARERSKFRAMTQEKRIDYLAARSQHAPIMPDEVWRNILIDIMDDDMVVRYLTLLNLDTSTSEIHTFVSVLTLKPGLMDYCWKLAFEAQTEPAE